MSITERRYLNPETGYFDYGGIWAALDRNNHIGWNGFDFVVEEAETEKGKSIKCLNEQGKPAVFAEENYSIDVVSQAFADVITRWPKYTDKTLHILNCFRIKINPDNPDTILCLKKVKELLIGFSLASKSELSELHLQPLKPLSPPLSLTDFTLHEPTDEIDLPFYSQTRMTRHIKLQKEGEGFTIAINGKKLGEATGHGGNILKNFQGDNVHVYRDYEVSYKTRVVIRNLVKDKIQPFTAFESDTFCPSCERMYFDETFEWPRSILECTKMVFHTVDPNPVITVTQLLAIEQPQEIDEAIYDKFQAILRGKRIADQPLIDQPEFRQELMRILYEKGFYWIGPIWSEFYHRIFVNQKFDFDLFFSRLPAKDENPIASIERLVDEQVRWLEECPLIKILDPQPEIAATISYRDPTCPHQVKLAACAEYCTESRGLVPMWIMMINGKYVKPNTWLWKILDPYKETKIWVLDHSEEKVELLVLSDERLRWFTVNLQKMHTISYQSCYASEVPLFLQILNLEGQESK